MIPRSTPLKRTYLRRKPSRKRKGADPDYLAWIRQLGCLLCGAYGTEAAHCGVRGVGQKCPDRESLPLCAYHHRTGKESHHRLGRFFWIFHSLDRAQLLASYQAAYIAQTGKAVLCPK